MLLTRHLTVAIDFHRIFFFFQILRKSVATVKCYQHCLKYLIFVLNWSKKLQVWNNLRVS